MNPKVLIANRGEISNHIIHTCKRLGFITYCIYTQQDAHALNVKNADYSILLPSGSLALNYLNASLIVEKAKLHGIDAIHPGYGFLSESCQFASMIQKAAIKWIGPTIQNIKDFGSKHYSKLLAQQAGVPTLQATAIIDNSVNAALQAQKLGYPIMIKGSDAGGGIGMFKCNSNQEVEKYFPIAQQKSITFFNSDSIFLEKYLEKAHHIQIQIIGDGKGNVYAIGQRECSAQRRNQKVIEETPSPFIDQKMRQQMKQAATKLTKLIKYESVGTVEFIVDHQTRKFYFLQVNTRLQVEHPITEMTFGIDLVEIMINIAFKIQIDWQMISQISKIQRGYAIQARIYAENPLKDFQPSPGRINYLKFPQENQNLRIDTWIDNDITISHCYDPLLAKMISYGQTREIAIQKLVEGLKFTKIQGIQTNLQFLGQVIRSQTFTTGYNLTTNFLNQFTYTSYSLQIVEAGVYSLIQDYPGRVGYWNIGVPPSGPMDSFSFRIANFLVGNSGDQAGIEVVLDGITLKFNCDAVISVTGSQAQIIVNGECKQMYKSIFVEKESQVNITLVTSKGCRSYIGIKGGIQVQNFLGSKSTFPAGKFGGLTGNSLQKGDFLHLLKCQKQYTELIYPLQFRPQMANQYTIYAMAGPHYSPDYFTTEDIKTLWSHCYIVNHNSNRLGIRLSGFSAKFARQDGGDAGLHPSNIHDYPYAIGSMNFSGNTPIILTLDGPSLGGFACPLTVIHSEMWKIGQLRAGDKVYIKQVDYDYAVKSKAYQQNIIQLKHIEVRPAIPKNIENLHIDPVIETINIDSLTLKFRAAGESHLLCDLLMDKFGLQNRFFVELLLRTLKDLALEGIEEFIPGVSSLLIKYEPSKIKMHYIIDQVKKIVSSSKSHKDMIIPCRTVCLPISFRDKSTIIAIQRYRMTIRSEAPYLPDNCTFVQTINDIPSLDALAKMIQDTTYLVLGLGDVYLGSPCAVPLDPRHRILTTKYDPARTYTPEGAVGIGGIYMCHYGMDSPGGYQLMGRSIPIWYTYHNNPWLLDFFDQVKYYLVSEQQLQQLRISYRGGKFKPKIENAQFSYKKYMDFLQENKASIDEYEKQHTIKKIASKMDWSLMKNATNMEQEPEQKVYTSRDGLLIKSKLYGNLYEILIKQGDVVRANQPLMHIEVMKMSITLTSPVDGYVIKILKKTGKIVKDGEILCLIKPIQN